MSQVDKKSSRCSLDKMTSAPKQKSIMGLKAECGKETKEIPLFPLLMRKLFKSGGRLLLIESWV